MRLIPLLSGTVLLTALASAQTPVPPRTPKPAPRPSVAPAPAAPLPHLWGPEGQVPGFPHVELPHVPLFEWTMPSFDFDAHFDFDHDFHFNFDTPFELFQATPLPPLPGELAWSQMPSVTTPMALMPGVPTPGGLTWTTSEEPRGALLRLRPEQGSPEDSLYRAAREALNRGEYSRASTLFQSLEQRYPRSRVAPAALYYRAFALYRSGATPELRAAVEALKAQQQRYPEAATDPDAATLRTRLYAALAARGDAEAASALRAATAGGPSCDKEDVEVRAEALNALAQINPPEARPTLKKVLARRDECSVRLRRSAVYILGRTGTDESAADLLEVAKSDPDPSVRSDAIVLLGRSPGATTVRTLETIFNESQDDRTRQAALSALRNKGGPEATRVLRTIIEREDVSERMRAEAISQLAGGAMNFAETKIRAEGQRTATVAGPQGATRRDLPDNEESAYLRAYFGKTTSVSVRASIISALARMGGSANEQFLLGIVKNREEDSRIRREALSRLRVSALSVDELSKLFEALSERDLRNAVVSQLASREEPEAIDKLIEIIKSGTDPQIRLQAISALSRKKDPRATKFLLELVEKQP